MRRAWLVDVEDAGTGIGFSVSPQDGGELSSIRAIHKGVPVELLHQGGGGWRGRAPWLFPAVGRSCLRGRVGFYEHRGKTYRMPIHGFVMDRAWELVSAEDGVVTCRTQSDAATRRMYPFDFALRATYSLRRGGLQARLLVAASSDNDGPMPFSLGNHLTLSLPLGPRKAGGCVVRSPARKKLLLSPQGFLTGKTVAATLKRGLALSAEPGLRDMVLGGYATGRAWAEVTDPNGVRVRVQQSPASAKQARFVFYSDGKTYFCPEPWYGEPNALNEDRALTRLAPGKTFEWEMGISIRHQSDARRRDGDQ